MNSTSESYSAKYLAESRSQQLIDACIVLAVFETLFAGLYFTIQYRTKKLLSLNTILMLPAFFLCFSHIVISIRKLK